MTFTKPVMDLTATQIIHGPQGAQRIEHDHGSSFPIHPALAILEWEDDRTDVHGIACRTHGHSYDGGTSLVWLACHCGTETAKHPTEDAATAELVEHALITCAACHGPKPAGNFPRCSNCAF